MRAACQELDTTEEEELALVPLRAEVKSLEAEAFCDPTPVQFLTEEITPDVGDVRNFLKRDFSPTSDGLSGRLLLKAIATLEDQSEFIRENGVSLKLLSDHLELRGTQIQSIVTALEIAEHAHLLTISSDPHSNRTYRLNDLFRSKSLLEEPEPLSDEASSFLALKFSAPFRDGSTLRELMLLFSDQVALAEVLQSEGFSEILGDANFQQAITLLEDRLIPQAVSLGILEEWTMPKNWSRYSGAPGFILSEAATYYLKSSQPS